MTRITNNKTAIEWLKENEPDAKINEDRTTVQVTTYCGRCGGTGRYGWQGVCWACNGRNSKITKQIPVKKYAQQEKAAKNRRDKAAKRRQEYAKNRQERLLEGQRDWCEKNGYGRITFDEKKQLQNEYWEKINRSKVHIGKVGMKIDLEVTFQRTVGFETAYGYMHIHKFHDEAENVLVWKTSCGIAQVGKLPKKGDKMRLRGTIKAHNEYRQCKQTVMTRCKLEM